MLGTVNCSDEDLVRLTGLLTSNEDRGLVLLAELLRDHPQDPRLHFLDGSLLAARRDYRAAREAMIRAITFDPDYAIARFQLGLLLLTEAEPDAARAVWAPLLALDPKTPLYLFAMGLDLLATDQLAEAQSWLERGMATNDVNPAMNHDMRLILQEIRTRLSSEPVDDQGAEEPMLSAAQMLLQQSAMRSTKH